MDTTLLDHKIVFSAQAPNRLVLFHFLASIISPQKLWNSLPKETCRTPAVLLLRKGVKTFHGVGGWRVGGEAQTEFQKLEVYFTWRSLHDYLAIVLTWMDLHWFFALYCFSILFIILIWLLFFYLSGIIRFCDLSHLDSRAQWDMGWDTHFKNWKIIAVIGGWVWI